MSLLLHIDTALETASICLSDATHVIESVRNENQRDHAAWIHTAIEKILSGNKFTPSQLSAISVSAGPGSYTGLRVGLSTAKGLCYALQKPLIAISTLKMMANATEKKEGTLLCPMIDARRMEVFTALFDHTLNEIEKPHAAIIDENFMNTHLDHSPVIFFGNGSKKAGNILKNRSAFFYDVAFNACDLVTLAYQAFKAEDFANMAYIEPYYVKEFYTTAKINNTI